MSSEEWRQGGKVLADRKTEYEQCKILQNEKLKALHTSQQQLQKQQEKGKKCNQILDYIMRYLFYCFVVYSAEQLVTSIAAATAELKALHRHTATLKKEIDLDERERNAVEDSVNNCLTSALNDYAIVLELSTVARKLRIIFNYFSCIYVK